MWPEHQLPLIHHPNFFHVIYLEWNTRSECADSEEWRRYTNEKHLQRGLTQPLHHSEVEFSILIGQKAWISFPTGSAAESQRFIWMRWIKYIIISIIREVIKCSKTSNVIIKNLSHVIWNAVMNDCRCASFWIQCTSFRMKPGYIFHCSFANRFWMAALCFTKEKKKSFNSK